MFTFRIIDNFDFMSLFIIFRKPHKSDGLCIKSQGHTGVRVMIWDKTIVARFMWL